ncbi:hypothetical protein Leryth_019356, partial [Lithospermum erythrorhizon]
RQIRFTGENFFAQPSISYTLTLTCPNKKKFKFASQFSVQTLYIITKSATKNSSNRVEGYFLKGKKR